MMSPKDPKDGRRPGTPAAGVRAVVDEEPRDVASRLAEAAFASIGELRKEVRASREEVQEYSRRDQEDHNRIYDTLTGVTDRIDAQGGRLDQVVGRLGELGEQFGNVSGKLEILTTVIQEDRQAERERAMIKLTGETEVGTAHKKDEIRAREFKRKLFLKIVAWMTPVFVALAGGITIALQRC